MPDKTGFSISRRLRSLASLKLTVVLLLLLCFLVIAGTALQAESGLYAAQRAVFSSWLFLLFGVVPLPGMLTVALLLFINLLAAAAWRLQYRWRRAGLILLHYGLLLLIASGFVISLTAREYFLTLREGESGRSLTLADGRSGASLPFTLTLLDFEKALHPGTDIPKSFTSRVEIREGQARRRAVISMNRPLRLRGYTFYQSAYAEEEEGRESSTFSVVQGAGRRLPYFASAMLFLGLLLHWLAMIAAAMKKRQAPGAGSAL
ncbi:MAG: cytochrome c biogenesis protein ResB [Acidobacteria bacterium]|jgi:hypothetical protein|nr:cytochrome c biogenesis protein ResB [Acidobacteriota bacterium]